MSYIRDQLDRTTRLVIPASTAAKLDYTYTSLGQIDTITRQGTTPQLADYNYAEGEIKKL